MEINAHNLSLTATLSTSNLTEDDLTFVWGNKNSIRANTSGSHLNSDAKYAYSKGDSCYAWGDYSYAEGYGPSTPTSDSGYTYVEPTSDIESFKSLYSTAWRPQIAVGEYSRVYGENNLAFGDHSIAMGNDNQVYGNNTIALGNGITANEYLTNSVIITSNLANYRLNLNPTEEVKNCLFVGGSQTVFSPTNSDSIYVNGGLYLMQDVNFELTAEHLYNTRMNIGLTQPYIEMVPDSSSTNSAYISMSNSSYVNPGSFSLTVDTRSDVDQYYLGQYLDYVQFRGDAYIDTGWVPYVPDEDTSDTNSLPSLNVRFGLFNTDAELAASNDYMTLDIIPIFGSSEAISPFVGILRVIQDQTTVGLVFSSHTASSSVGGATFTQTLTTTNEIADYYDRYTNSITFSSRYSVIRDVTIENSDHSNVWNWANSSTDSICIGRMLNNDVWVYGKMNVGRIVMSCGYNPDTGANDVNITLLPYRNSDGIVGFMGSNGIFYAPAEGRLYGYVNGEELKAISKSQTACINIGSANVLNEDYSYAFGRNITVNGQTSLAVGDGCSIWNAQAVAAGINSIAFGNYSTAFGGGGVNITDELYLNMSYTELYALWAQRWTIDYTNSNDETYHDSFHMAYGKGSTVFGKNNFAGGDYSFVVGEGNVSNAAHQFVCGKYNSENSSRGFIIGYGSDRSSRTNVVSFSFEGNGWMTGTLSQGSDARLKDNIEDLGVKGSLRLVEFDWKSTGKHGYGFIADEVEQIYPSMVNEDNDDGYKYLDYNAAICAKLAELEQEIDELKSKLES